MARSHTEAHTSRFEQLPHRDPRVELRLLSTSILTLDSHGVDRKKYDANEQRNAKSKERKKEDKATRTRTTSLSIFHGVSGHHHRSPHRRCMHIDDLASQTKRRENNTVLRNFWIISMYRHLDR